MTKTHWIIASVTVVVLALIIGFYSMRIAEIENDKIQIQEQNKVERTSERWKFLPNFRKTK